MINYPMPAFGILLWKQLRPKWANDLPDYSWLSLKRRPVARDIVEADPQQSPCSARYYRAIDIATRGERELMDDGFIGVLYNDRIKKAPYP